MKVRYLFGPSLGALGQRDAETYGDETLEEIMAAVAERAEGWGTRSTGGSPIARATSSVAARRRPRASTPS